MSELESESPMITAGNSNVPDFDDSGDVKYLGYLDQLKWDTMRSAATQTPGLSAALQEIAYQIKCRRIAPLTSAEPEEPTWDPRPEPEPEAGVTYKVPRDKRYVALVKVLSQEIFENAADLIAAANQIVEAVEAEVNA